MKDVRQQADQQKTNKTTVRCHFISAVWLSPKIYKDVDDIMEGQGTCTLSIGK